MEVWLFIEVLVELTMEGLCLLEGSESESESSTALA